MPRLSEECHILVHIETRGSELLSWVWPFFYQILGAVDVGS